MAIGLNIFDAAFLEVVDELSAEDRLALYDAILHYFHKRIEPELTGTPKMIFTLLRSRIDQQIADIENGKKGALVKAQNNEKKAKKVSKKSSNFSRKTTPLNYPPKNQSQFADIKEFTSTISDTNFTFQEKEKIEIEKEKQETPPTPPKEVKEKEKDKKEKEVAHFVCETRTREDEPIVVGVKINAIDKLRNHFFGRSATEQLMMSLRIPDENTYRSMVDSILAEWSISDGVDFPVNSDRKRHLINRLRCVWNIRQKERATQPTNREEARQRLMQDTQDYVKYVIAKTDYEIAQLDAKRLQGAVQ